MDIRSLRYFVTITEQQSYTKAAQELFISQPALSKTIKVMENQLGFDLFDHDAKTVTLTKYGQILLEDAVPFLQHFDNIMDTMNSLRQWGTRTITISCSSLVNTLFLAEIIQEFHKLHPDITLDVLDDSHFGNCNAVKDGSSDLAIVSYCQPPEPLTMKLVCYDEMVAVFTKENILAQREYVTFEDVRDQTFYIFGSSHFMHQEITDRCQQAGYMPRIGSANALSLFLLNVLKTPQDMAILPMPFMRKTHGAEHFPIVPFRPTFPYKLGLLYNENRLSDPAVATYLDFTIKKFAEFQMESPFSIDVE